MKQEKKGQGVADRRKWNEEKYRLIREHDNVLKLMGVNPREARCLAATAKKAAKPQPNHASDGAADDQLLKSM